MLTSLDRFDSDGNTIAIDKQSGMEVSAQFFSTKSGENFLQEYDSDANYLFLIEKTQASGRPVTAPNLVVMFESLKRIGGIKKVVTPVAPSKRDPARNPLTGEIVSHEMMDFYLSASSKDRRNRQSVDAVFDKLVKDIITYEMSVLPAQNPASGIPPKPTRPWVSDSEYERLKLFAREFKALSSEQMHRRMSPVLSEREDAEKFKQDVEAATSVGLL